MGIGYKSLGIFYTLKGGGELIAASVAAQTPEPSTLLLFAAVWARSSPTEGGDSGLLLRFAREPKKRNRFCWQKFSNLIDNVNQR